ncbi:MAG: helix-turn-helix domain-containing protein [Oscillospiraceae bacterium]|nr:helix-turn-helix domain-containing protein [Oscillospiraceae bacterium]
MEKIAERLLDLRQNMKLTQQKLSKLLGISQTAINRYEHGETAINANALLKYADFFDVSADYILGRCDDPQGKKYGYQPEFLKDKLANSDEWKEFVEMCFSPGSPINNKLKEMLVQMAGNGIEK